MRLSNLHGDHLVHVRGKSRRPDGPAADVQQVLGGVGNVAADPGSAVPLHETFGPACSHQSRLPVGEQRHPPLRRHRLPNANPDLDQNLSEHW